MSQVSQVAYRAPIETSPAQTKTQSVGADVFNWAIPVYLLLLSGGFAFLRSPMASMRGNELSIDRAAFTAINAVTLTGFGQAIGLNELRTAGQIGVFLMMAGGTALSLIIGGHLVCRIVRLPFTNRQILLATGAAIAVAALFGAAGLGDTLAHGAFDGVSALGNCGLVLGKTPACDETPTVIILLPLAIAGGLGLPVWLDLLGAFLKRKPISAHTLISLSIFGGAYIVGSGLLLTQLNLIQSIPNAVATCSASAITSRSAGFPMVPLDQFTRTGQWLLAGLMVLGPASGGTGGGLKGTSLFSLFRGLRNAYRGERGDRTMTIAATWIAGYAMLVFVGFLTLLSSAPQTPVDRLLFLALSAASNVGWSHDPISMVRGSLATLSIIALLGRALPMLVLWWMARAVREADVSIG